ncbi:hypothetical protein TELCIR_26016 [Teladorsagia circumcincta]|uniref:Uncharacterized protein n=1 Tax=Teladorsagia circumcincta TaxID=45464 RepID=A0A2G9T430_TELCI|nr:hypothetical protein TELCIR_26016 [Teladorsagia circumcincta]
MWGLSVAFAIVVTSVQAKISCKNMQGDNVDWFVAMKLPAATDKRKGLSFVYADSSTEGWVMSEDPINSTHSAIGATVKQIYIEDKVT